MKIPSLIFWMILLGVAPASDLAGPHVFVGGSSIERSGPYEILSTSESLADLLNRIGVKITKGDYIRYQEGKPVTDVTIKLFRAANVRSFRIDPKSDELWNIRIQENDTIEISREPFGGVFFSVMLKLKKPIQGEQDGADEPATVPESKPEANEKPKPESEVRPQ